MENEKKPSEDVKKAVDEVVAEKAKAEAKKPEKVKVKVKLSAIETKLLKVSAESRRKSAEAAQAMFDAAQREHEGTVRAILAEHGHEFPERGEVASKDLADGTYLEWEKPPAQPS